MAGQVLLVLGKVGMFPDMGWGVFGLCCRAPATWGCGSVVVALQRRGWSATARPWRGRAATEPSLCELAFCIKVINKYELAFNIKVVNNELDCDIPTNIVVFVSICMNAYTRVYLSMCICVFICIHI